MLLLCMTVNGSNQNSDGPCKIKLSNSQNIRLEREPKNLRNLISMI